MNIRQLGKFFIDRQWVKEEPEKVAEVFAMLKLVPLRCDGFFGRDRVEYIGISERFTEIQQGMIIPEYTLKITQSEAGNIELVEVEKDK